MKKENNHINGAIKEINPSDLRSFKLKLEAGQIFNEYKNQPLNLKTKLYADNLAKILAGRLEMPTNEYKNELVKTMILWINFTPDEQKRIEDMIVVNQGDVSTVKLIKNRFESFTAKCIEIEKAVQLQKHGNF